MWSFDHCWRLNRITLTNKHKIEKPQCNCPKLLLAEVRLCTFGNDRWRSVVVVGYAAENFGMFNIPNGCSLWTRARRKRIRLAQQAQHGYNLVHFYFFTSKTTSGHLEIGGAAFWIFGRRFQEIFYLNNENYKYFLLNKCNFYGIVLPNIQNDSVQLWKFKNKLLI